MSRTARQRKSRHTTFCDSALKNRRLGPKQRFSATCFLFTAVSMLLAAAAVIKLDPFFFVTAAMAACATTNAATGLCASCTPNTFGETCTKNGYNDAIEYLDDAQLIVCTVIIVLIAIVWTLFMWFLVGAEILGEEKGGGEEAKSVLPEEQNNIAGDDEEKARLVGSPQPTAEAVVDYNDDATPINRNLAPNAAPFTPYAAPHQPGRAPVPPNGRPQHNNPSPPTDFPLQGPYARPNNGRRLASDTGDDEGSENYCHYNNSRHSRSPSFNDRTRGVLGAGTSQRGPSPTHDGSVLGDTRYVDVHRNDDEPSYRHCRDTRRDLSPERRADSRQFVEPRTQTHPTTTGRSGSFDPPDARASAEGVGYELDADYNGAASLHRNHGRRRVVMAANHNQNPNGLNATNNHDWNKNAPPPPPPPNANNRHNRRASPIRSGSFNAQQQQQNNDNPLEDLSPVRREREENEPFASPPAAASRKAPSPSRRLNNPINSNAPPPTGPLRYHNNNNNGRRQQHNNGNNDNRFSDNEEDDGQQWDTPTPPPHDDFYHRGNNHTRFNDGNAASNNDYPRGARSPSYRDYDSDAPALGGGADEISRGGVIGPYYCNARTNVPADSKRGGQNGAGAADRSVSVPDFTNLEETFPYRGGSKRGGDARNLDNSSRSQRYAVDKGDANRFSSNFHDNQNHHYGGSRFNHNTNNSPRNAASSAAVRGSPFRKNASPTNSSRAGIGGSSNSAPPVDRPTPMSSLSSYPRPASSAK